MEATVKGVRVRPAMIVDNDGQRVQGQVRNPARNHAFVAADGENLPMNAWLLRMVRKGNLVAISDAGDPIEIDDFGNEIVAN